MADGVNITRDDLQLSQQDEQDNSPLNLKEVRQLAETSAINRALGYTNNNVSNAAKLLGVTRPILYALFTKYGMQMQD